MKNNKNLSNTLFIFIIIIIFISYFRLSSNEFNKSITFNKDLEKVNIDPILIKKIETEFPIILKNEYNLSNEEINKILKSSKFEELTIKESSTTNLYNREIPFSFTTNIILWKSGDFISILSTYSEEFYSKNDILKSVSNPKITIDKIKPYKVDNEKDIIKLNATVDVKLNKKNNNIIKTLNHYFYFN